MGLATVYQCEMIAVLKAACNLLEEGVGGKVINFFTDNQAVIQSLNNIFTRSPLVEETKQVLKRLNNGNFVTMNWVPGHEGHLGNEIADRLAKRGTKTEFIGPLPVIPCDKGVNHRKIRKWAGDRHKDKWKETEHAKTLHFIIRDYDERKRENFLEWERYQMRVFLNTTTGQTGLNKLLFNANIHDNPICEACGLEVEGSMHFLVHCDKYARLRYDTYGFGLTAPEELQQVPLKSIVKFIIASKRFIYRGGEDEEASP